MLYNMPADRRPLVIGKTDEDGRILLPSDGELTPTGVAHGDRQPADEASAATRPSCSSAWRASKPRRSCSARRRRKVARTPYFCSGCPHNTSTRVPEGSRAMAGIGCHGMAIWMPERRTALITPHGRRGRGLGRPGAVHRRASTSSRTSATAPTTIPACWRSAQPAAAERQHHLQDPLQRRGRHDRRPAATTARSPCREITRQVAAEGAKRIVVVTDEPDKYRPTPDFADGVDRPPSRRARRRAARAARDRRASRSWSTTRPAPPRSAAAASAARSPIRQARLHQRRASAKAAAIARRSRTASR